MGDKLKTAISIKDFKNIEDIDALSKKERERYFYLLNFDIRDGVLVGYGGADLHVFVPDGVTVIGEKAFADCDYAPIEPHRHYDEQLKEEAVSELQPSGKPRIKNVTLPPSVTVIAERAFWYARALESVTGAGVKRIGEEAFRCCESLMRVDFPVVTELCDRCFYECDKLKHCVFPNAKKAGKHIFGWGKEFQRTRTANIKG